MAEGVSKDWRWLFDRVCAGGSPARIIQRLTGNRAAHRMAKKSYDSYYLVVSIGGQQELKKLVQDGMDYKQATTAHW